MKRTRDDAIDAMLLSDEPSVRWKAMVRAVGEDPRSRRVRDLQQEIRKSLRVKALLAGRAREAQVYAKWRGAHWTLSALAELGYPAGDESLLPMCDRVLDFWLSKTFYTEFDSKRSTTMSRSEGIPRIQGRYRAHASQQGNALYSLTRLGLVNARCDGLVERLLHWQWPDGGWNCDRNLSADTSSFMETMLPMLGLAVHADRTGEEAARGAASKASEVFLRRQLFKRLSDGTVIHPNFLIQHYPRYWHYDVLGGLVAMAEMGLINDPRCADALDLLERKELPGGGWAAEGRFYRVSPNLDASNGSGGSISAVSWGGSGKRRMNEWITVDALYVLRAADRL